MSVPNHVIGVNPHFDLQLLIKQTIQQQDLAETVELSFEELLSPPDSPALSPAPDDWYNNPSPLTSPEPTPPPSPLQSLSSFPKIKLPSRPTKRLSSPPSSSPPSSSPPSSKKAKVSKTKPPHRKARGNRCSSKSRRKQRGLENEAVDAHYEPRTNARYKHMDGAETIAADFDTQQASVSNSGFVAADRYSGSKKTYALDELVGDNSKFGFKLQKWDGRTEMAILDNSKRVIAVLAGHPEDEQWPLLQAEAADALESRRSCCYVSKKKRKQVPRRGPFIALPCGVSHGGGQKIPGNLSQDPHNEKVLEELNAMKPFKRLAGFASSVMATWAPKLHQYYKTNINCLHCRYPNLVRVFPASIFSAVSYNFGPRTVCHKHKDYANLAFGWCAVTALGYFDYTKGGHLVLWDLGLVIEFPPGSTILLPSAIIAHSNVAIGKDERRYSFAQYTAGGLFRWVENDFQTREEYLMSLSAEELAADVAKEASRWEFGLSLLPKVQTVA